MCVIVNKVISKWCFTALPACCAVDFSLVRCCWLLCCAVVDWRLSRGGYRWLRLLPCNLLRWMDPALSGFLIFVTACPKILCKFSVWTSHALQCTHLAAGPNMANTARKKFYSKNSPLLGHHKCFPHGQYGISAKVTKSKSNYRLTWRIPETSYPLSMQKIPLHCNQKIFHYTCTGWGP